MGSADPAQPVAEARGFDPLLARHPVLVVRIDEIIDLLEVSHAPERIEQYRAAMRSGELFPPVSVIGIAGRWFIADGHKRFQAYRTLGAGEIAVELWPWRRWLEDQWRQLRRKTRAQLALLLRLPHDGAARAAARRLFWDTLSHWQRVVLSAAGRRQRRG